MKRIYLITILLSIAYFVNGQVQINYQPTTDLLVKINKVNMATRSVANIMMLPTFDIQQMLEEDSLDQIGTVEVPFRFGKGFDTDLTLNESGLWQNTDDGRVWSMHFHSSKAKSLNFIFNDFYLPDSAELYIVNADQTVLYGPVTASCIPEDGFFMTDLILGEDVSIYLFEPNLCMGQSRLNITKVVHAYRGLSIETDGIMRSSESLLPCHNDVVCFSDWSNESSGIALVLLADGTAWCSGSLIMSADNSFRPYFLTAFHCIDADKQGSLSAAEINQAEHWMFKFGYKKSSCSYSYISSGISFNGAMFRSAYRDTDFALVELNSNPGNTQYPSATWLGWDKTGSTPLSGTYIHHPLGTPMKISFDVNTLSLHNGTLNWSNGASSINTHWKTRLDNGVVQPGSSGSPLLDQNKRVIGQLHGGNATCSYNEDTYSGAFHKSWTGGGSNSTRLSNWLDPNNSGVMTTNTSSYPYISGADIICPYDNPHSYSVSGIPANTSVTWTCTGGISISANGTSCTVNASTAGYASVSAHINSSTTILTKNIEVSSDPADPNAHVYVSGYSIGNGMIRLEVSAPAIYGIRSYIWNAQSIGGGGSSQSTQTGPNGDYWTITAGNYNVEVRAVTQCGHIVGSNTIYAAGSYSSSASPNPANNTLNVNIEELENEGVNALPAASRQTSAYYDIRLYNLQGTLLRSLRVASGQTSIDVSGLPGGNYFLHVYKDGTAEPQVHKIIISH